MTISYPLAFPTHKNPRTVTFRQKKAVGISTAPQSGVQQVYEWPAEFWAADVSFAPMSRADTDAWMAWLTSLRGPFGSFLMGDLSRATPRGTISGSPTVTGSPAAGARTLSTSSGSGNLKAGDWLQIGTGTSSRLYKVLQDVTLGSAIDIWPGLRSAYSNGTAVTYSSAKGIWLATAVPAEEQNLGGGMFQIPPMTCVEDLRQ